MTNNAHPGFGEPAPSVRVSVRSPGARRWYGGGTVGVLWLVNLGFDMLGNIHDPGSRVAILVLLVVYATAFLLSAPLSWGLRARYRLLPATALLALSFAFFPWLGLGVFSLWAYVGVAAAMSLVGFRTALVYIAGLSLLAALFAWGDGVDGDAIFFTPALIASVSLMMAAFGRMIRGMNQLRATQHELARLAVEQERSRVARDMHDILGHSLTVITVKAELAGRLIESDPVRAAQEVAELEELSRGALADVRSTVAGYRGVSIASELANARSALEAASITAHLPGTVDRVPADRRELFGWVVREGVTNVVRHSKARTCRIELGADSVEVSDDGAAPAGTTPGVGLAGLRERVESAGLRMTAGPLPTGGFRLRVSA